MEQKYAHQNSGFWAVMLIIWALLLLFGCKSGVKYTRSTVEYKAGILSRPDVMMQSSDSLTVIKIDHLTHREDSVLVACPRCNLLIKIHNPRKKK